MKRLLIAFTCLVAAFVGITWLALEASSVVVVVTDDGEGEQRLTRIWYVDTPGGVALEAGHPDNPWVLDLNAATTLGLQGEALDGHYEFLLVENSGPQIRKLMRDKYGWRDVWISLIFDVSRSQMVVLTPVD